MKNKRVSTRSVNAAVKAMVNAGKPLPAVPDHVRLRPEDMPFWDGIVRARARDEWSEVDLVVAAQLSRCQGDIERESLLLEEEKTVLLNQRGTMVANPRVSVLEQLARREMALMRALRIGGSSAGDRRDESGRRNLEASADRARKEVEEQDEDELLAR